jgi:DNA-binding transcriptional ArsR family regulator
MNFKEEAVSEVSRLCKALSVPTRASLFLLLLEDKKDGIHLKVTDIAVRAKLPLGAVSQHLASLERAGLLTRKTSGRSVFFCVEPSMSQDARIFFSALANAF